MSVRIFLCISSKINILFEQFVTCQETKRATLVPCSFLGVANITLKLPLRRR